MDPEEWRFSGKVYTRRAKKKEVSPTTIAAVTSVETKVFNPEKVNPQTKDLLMIANSATSGVVPDGCGGAVIVSGGNGGGGSGGQPDGDDEVADLIYRVEDRVRIRLTGSTSIVEKRNVRRTLEEELDHVRSMLNKIEARENHTVIGGVVERGKRIRKENKYYSNSEYLLAKDRLPCERNKKKNGMKDIGFALNRDRIDLSKNWGYQMNRDTSTSRNVRHPLPPISPPQVSRTPIPKKPKAKELNRRDMTYEEKRKLCEDVENIPSENLPSFVRIVMKRGIERIDTETLWEVDRFVTKYNKNNKRKAEVVASRTDSDRDSSSPYGSNAGPKK